MIKDLFSFLGGSCVIFKKLSSLSLVVVVLEE